MEMTQKKMTKKNNRNQGNINIEGKTSKSLFNMS